ncbi:MAG: FAD-binding protein, partial [Dongiaceae bacterium]
MTDAAPANEQQVAEFLRWALGEEAPVELIGNGTKRRLGARVQAAHTLSMRALSGITLYEPEELVLRALPGTPIA